MTQAKLSKLLKKWQPLLRLADWAISTEMRPATLMPNYEEGVSLHYGQANYDIHHKQALVILADPKTMPTIFMKYDVEQTLVHELLHLVLEPLVRNRKDGDDNVDEEQIVNQLSYAFCDLTKDK